MTLWRSGTSLNNPHATPRNRESRSGWDTKSVWRLRPQTVKPYFMVWVPSSYRRRCCTSPRHAKPTLRDREDICAQIVLLLFTSSRALLSSAVYGARPAFARVLATCRNTLSLLPARHPPTLEAGRLVTRSQRKKTQREAERQTAATPLAGSADLP